MDLVLLDFDGTITTSDTLLAFTRFAVGSARYAVGMILLSPALVLQRLKVFSSQHTKEIFLRHFFAGWTVSAFESRCQLFDTDVLPGLIRPGALDVIVANRQAGNRTVIVSASPHYWIQPWAAQWGVEVIGTRLEIQDGKLTGKISGKNCNQEEKVIRVRELLNPADYKQIIAYGDTSGDEAMLNFATQKHFKPFRD